MDWFLSGFSSKMTNVKLSAERARFRRQNSHPFNPLGGS